MIKLTSSRKSVFVSIILLLSIFTQAQIAPDSNGIIYVKTAASGNGDGSNWANATNDLHNAIFAENVQKVFVAVGNYPVGSSSFIMKNNVAIYGGFDPANGITDLSHNRILPTASINGSVLDGENTRPLIWNEDNYLNSSAILDGFTITRGKGGNGGGIFNGWSSPAFYNLVIKENTATFGGGVFNYVSNSTYTNVEIINNTAVDNNLGSGGGMGNNRSNPILTNVNISNNYAKKEGGGMNNGEYCSPVLTNVKIANNTADVTGGAIYYWEDNGTAILNNVTVVNNTAPAIDILASSIDIRNSIIYGAINGSYTYQYSLIEGNTSTANGNLDATGVTPNTIFTNPANGDYTLKTASPAINVGNNALNSTTTDLAGNARIYNNGVIDLGAYESLYSPPVSPDANGIVYVKPDGTGNGSSWANATNDLHNAIHAAGVQKVFVAVGNYNVGADSFIMKNGVGIYGGFDPENGITDLTHNRIMPNASHTNGSILNGQNVRPVIWNVFTSETIMDNSAVLDGFTIIGGSYSNGAGIRNVYASPTLRNLVIRANSASASGAGIFNNFSSPVIFNTIISSNILVNTINNVYGAGMHNNNNSAPVIVNTTITGNQLIATTGTLNGAGIFNSGGSSPKIYNSIIWNNTKNNNPAASGADIENINASLTLKNSITQSYTTSNPADNNKVGENPLFANAGFGLSAISPGINYGNNSYYTGLNATTKDLAGNLRLVGTAIDMGAYEFENAVISNPNGIIYVRETATGNGTGISWANATSDLHNAIHASGVQKVFVAVGNYKVGDHSFFMKNNVEIYGGFDPVNGIVDLDDNRIMPNPENSQGSILDGENIRPVFWNVFTSETAINNTAILDGFKITKGYVLLEGAGMRNVNASPTLRNLVFSSNHSYRRGAGMSNENSSPILTDCVFFDNNGEDYGGAIYNISNSSLTATNCSFISNSSYYGAGIYNQSSVTLVNCTFSDNVAGISGGAIYNSSWLVATNCNFTSNSANRGAALANFSGNAMLTNCLVADNTTAVTGHGAIHHQTSGGGTYTNVTFVNNGTLGFSVVSNDIDINFRNSIVWDAVANYSYNIENSLIQGLSSTANGNIDATGILITDIFTDPENGIYTLKENSPAVNAGNNILFTGLDESTEDLGGNPRVHNYNNSGVIDLGAYESIFNAPLAPNDNGTIYVKETSTGTGSGNSWENATSDLHNAIHIESVQKVFVAVGEYKVGDNSFIMKEEVEIYGGFDPDNSIDDLTDNRILPNKGMGDGSVLNGENTRTVVWNHDNALTPSALLDGFTITNGIGVEGGGIHNYNSSPTLSNLVVKNNTATNSGGGIFSVWSDNPVITDVIVTENTATYLGGGIYISIASSPITTNVSIIGNTTGGNGGGIYNNYSTLVLNTGEISNNTAANRGGGIYNNETTADLNNVKLSGNTANNGGGMYNTVNTVFVSTNLQICDNAANNLGGGIYSESVNSTFINITVANNTAPNTESTAAMYVDYGTPQFNNSVVFGTVSGNYTAQYSLIQGNSDTSNGNLDATGITTDDVFKDAAGGDYSLKDASLAVNAGNNALFTGLDENTLDLAGNPRLVGTAIDLGAYESQAASSGCPDSTTWDGFTWSNGIPDSSTQAVIDGELTLGSDLEACELEVTANGNLTIPSGFTFTVNGLITNHSTSESLVVENGGNLIQINDNENLGAITVIRDSQPMIRLDYTLWSSPVINQNLFGFSPETVNGVTNYPGSTGRIYIYDGDNGYVNPNPFTADAVMNPGVGYLFRSPNNWNPSVPQVYEGIFTGVPFNGGLSVATVAGNYNSVGNPYPSAIDADDFILANPGVSTLYFWNNNHNSGNNYAVCSLGNCVAAAGGGNTPNGVIAAGQGFIILTNDPSVNFDNSMRTSQSAFFFKTDETEKHRFWLNLSGAEDQGYNQILISYMSGATNGIDNQLDGKLFGYGGSALYSLIDAEKLVIQGRALPFEVSDVVPLGFRAAQDGKFKISLDNFDGLFAEGDLNIYLRDKQLNIIHNLIQSGYEFDSQSGEFSERFEVIYQTENIMGTGDLTSGTVQIYTQNQNIVVESETEKILSVELFDLNGRCVHRNSKVNANYYQVRAVSKGIIVVKVQTENGEIATKKLINK